MKFLRRDDGFTLVEMLIVLLIISVLILITIPNITKHFKTIDNKGCEAYVKMVDSQIEAYRVEQPRDNDVTIADLSEKEYLKSTDVVNGKLQCPDGRSVVIVENKAQVENKEAPKNEGT